MPRLAEKTHGGAVGIQKKRNPSVGETETTGDMTVVERWHRMIIRLEGQGVAVATDSQLPDGILSGILTVTEETLPEEDLVDALLLHGVHALEAERQSPCIPGQNRQKIRPNRTSHRLVYSRQRLNQSNMRMALQPC